MSSVGEKTSVRLRPAPPTVRLKVWPLRDEPIRSGALLTLLAVIGLASGFAARSIAAGLLVSGLLSLTVIMVWLPITYEFGPKGLIYTTWRRRRRIVWPEIASYEILPEGVVISPVPKQQPLSSLRRVFIRFNGQREEVLGALEFYIQAIPANTPSTTRTMTSPGLPTPQSTPGSPSV